MLHLERPSIENLKETIKGLKEIQSKPTPFDIYQAEKLIEYMENDFTDYIQFLQKRESTEQPDGWVADTTLFLFNDEEFIGIFNIRHSLTEILKKRGGHIAYQIIPSARGKGYCQKGVELVLEWCNKNLGIKEVLITCHENNKASHKVMMNLMNKFGGHQKEDVIVDEHIERGVWIKTTR